MFHSATLKLTGWYLLILMSISVLFSIGIYNVATGEIRNRLDQFQTKFEQPDMMPYTVPGHGIFAAYRDDQNETANRNIMTSLVYVNLMILLGGGALSYALARRTLRQIEEAHEAQSRFVSDASHELRTPLAAMKSELEVALRDTKMTKDEMKQLLGSNLEEVNKLTTLSQTLLHLSKLDYASLEVGPVNLGDILDEVVQRYDKNANRITLKLPKDPILAKANASTVEELFTILVDNALKYSPKTGKISAALTRQGKHAAFTITNPGKGIPADKLPHIFDRFYRANESRTDGGAGLGLALAKEIVTLNKGELSVSSLVGKETSFRVLLPIFRKNQA
jgi:signal transduction histidine kinase